jgi:RHS Repeat.
MNKPTCIWLFVLLFCMSVAIESSAQQVENRYEFLHSSPNAAELGKYGFVPVNMSTGAMSTSVPLYTLQAGKISVPISLSYLSGGVQVDQTASHVGLNWALNAGGVITRIVRGKPDADILGRDEEYIPYPENTYTMNYDLARYLDAAKDGLVDTERDFFSYNFLDFTGKLIFDYSGQPLFTPLKKIDVDWIASDGTIDFIFTDELGIKYFFEAGETSRSLVAGIDCGKNYEMPKETAWYLTRIVHPQGDEVEFEYDWHTVTYLASVTQNSTALITNIDMGECGEGKACSPITNPDKICENRIYNTTARLKRITTNGHGDVNFYFSKGRLDLYDDYKLDSLEFVLPDSTVLNRWRLSYTFSNNTGYGNPLVSADGLNSRMFLTSVDEVANGETKPVRYEFEYDDINGMPKRLSFAQDHWGYFNGKNNSHLYPKNGLVAPRNVGGQVLFEGKGGDREPDPNFAGKGLLKKITYPTGGFSTIEYEPNTFWGEKTVYPSLYAYIDNAESHSVGGVGVTKTGNVFSAVNQDITLHFRVDYHEGVPEDPIHSFGEISIRAGQSYVVQNLRIAPGQVHTKKYYLQANTNYEVVIRAVGQVKSSGNFELYTDTPQLESQNIITGGMRVARVISYSPDINRKDTTRYLYAFASDTTRSSGVVASAGSYYQYSTTYRRCSILAGGVVGCIPMPCNYVSVASSSGIKPNIFSGSHIAYGAVIMSQGSSHKNGFEEHRFMINADTQGRIVYGEGLGAIPQTTSSWGNGLTTRITKFKKTANGFMPVSKVENTFKKDNRISQFVPSMVVRTKYNEACEITSATAVCTECRTTARYLMKYCQANHTHKYKWTYSSEPCGVRITGATCTANNASHEYYEIYNPCFGKVAGETVVIESALENVVAIEYRDYVHWFYQAGTREVTYKDNGDSIVTRTNRIFANVNHLQQTTEWTVTSDGVHLSTNFWYPDDYAGVAMTDSLKENHIVALPVKQQTYKNKKTVSGEMLMYNPDGTIAEVWKLQEAIPSDSIPHDETTLLLHGYKKEGRIEHDAGKPREVHYPDGRVATLIWAYGKKYLVAQIMNKSNAQVASVSGFNIETLEQSSSDSYIESQINLLRTSLTDAYITSYKYRPGVGVTSVTDPNSVTTYYEYDGFGRLKTIKDSDANIVQKFEYNFKL